MKLSEALRYRGRVLIGSQERKSINLTRSQYEHFDQITDRFNKPRAIGSWNTLAANNEHRAMILLFAACIAEDEGD